MESTKRVLKPTLNLYKLMLLTTREERSSFSFFIGLIFFRFFLFLFLLLSQQTINIIVHFLLFTLPEVVPCNKDGPMTVLYDRLVPILIDALQKLNKRVEILEKKRR